MPISEKPTVEFRIEILENAVFQIRRARIILDSDGTELTRTYNRMILNPGDDVSSQPAKIRQLIQVLWTPQVIADYKAALNARINS